MSERLFRGKRIDNGEWIEGSLIDDGRCFIAIHPSLAFGPTSKDKINGETLWGFYPFFEVDPLTVGQYTGLLDKNGKKIFEEDILAVEQISDSIEHFESPVKCPYDVVVKWDKCSWMWETIGTARKRYLHFPEAWLFRKCEVIGNIHDNPELLEANT